MPFFEPDSMPATDVYHLMSALVVPRPIAWVSTRSPEGVANLAPFSWYQMVSQSPATVQVTFAGRKDSLVNIEATGEFVVNTVDRAHLEAMNETAVDAPAHLEEPVLAGVAMTASSVVGPQRVASAPAAMECRLEQTVVFGSSTVVFGRVVAVHVADHLWRDGRVDQTALDAVGRAAGSRYLVGAEPLDLARPSWGTRT